MLRRGRIGLAHEDEDPAARVAGPRRPPFAAVDDVLVAIAHDRTLDVGGVRRSHRRLGHRERRANAPFEQWFEPLLLLFRRAVAFQHLHVAGVRRRAVEDFGRPRHAPHDLAQRRVLGVGQPGAVPGLGQEQVPQRRGFRLGLELFDHLRRLPAIALRHLRIEARLVRIDVIVHELLQPCPQCLHFRRIVEVHVVPSVLGQCAARIRSTCCQPNSAIGRARLPASSACALAALPASARAFTPCRMPAMRNMLYAM